MGSLENPQATSSTCPLAIVGMGMRLPGGVKTDSEFWDLLINKRCAQSEVPGDRYNIDAFYSSSGQKGTVCCRKGHFLEEDLTRFDAEFFSIPPVELAKMDPQQRLLLKVVWECMENAGQVGWQGGDVGCYVGTFGEDWLDLSNKDVQQVGKSRVTGTSDFAIANRISYQYNLKGPSSTVRTACSSALVGLDMAHRAIAAGECSSAVVAGSNLILTPTTTVAMSEEGALSPNGVSKAFDASADGYARGEAINAIFVKKLEDAVRDKDPIRAVIRGTGTNCDGKTAGMPTPSSEAQAELIRRTYRWAGISDLSQTGYIECHGTGTVVGDPVEAEGIAQTFGKKGNDIIVGAVKPNLGHSEGASGITSVIKAVLALGNKQIPPNIHFSSPNPKIPFKEAGLRVPTEVLPWPEDRMERISVNSFGIGGVNAHAILESSSNYLEEKEISEDHQDRAYLHIASADSMESLKKRLNMTQEYLSRSQHPVGDIAYTLGQRREHMSWRGFMVSDNNGQSTISGPAKSHAVPPPLAFVFNGQGAQWPGMGTELLRVFSSFRKSVEKMDAALQSLEDPPQWTILETLSDTNSEPWIGKAEFAQPLCSAVQIGLVDLLTEWNIRPSAVVGHSSGEIAAAYASGALTAEEAILVAYYRGKLTTLLPCEGTMAAVGMSPEKVQEILEDGAIIACENSPKSVTISGDVDKVEAVIKRIQAAHPGTFCRRLQVNIAYHSHHMKTIGDAYEAALHQHLGTQPPLVYSSVAPASQSVPGKMDAAYWRRNLESPVRFSSAVATLLKDRQNIRRQSAGYGPRLVSTLVRGKDPVASLMEAAGQMYTLGVNLKLKAVNGTGNVVTDLPLYPWQDHNAYWDESRVSKSWRLRQYPHHELLGSSVFEASDLEPIWRNVLRLEDLPWLEDHKVGRDIVFPGACYVSMVGEAIRRITNLHHYTVRRLYITSPLLMSPSASVEVMTSLKPEKLTSVVDSASYEFTISSFENGRWTKHCTGLVRGNPSRESVSSPMGPLARRVEPHTWYRALYYLGIDYGPCFQGLEDITASPSGGAANATVHQKYKESESFYQIHPTTIDQSLQLLLLAKSGGIVRHIEKPAVPKVIDEIHVGPAGQTLRMEASIDSIDEDTVDGKVTAKHEGQTVLQMQGCVFSPLDLGERVDDMAAVAVKWEPLIDLADCGNLVQGIPDRDSILLVEKLAILCIPETVRRIEPLTVEVPHLRRLRQWLESQNALLTSGGCSHLIPEAREWSAIDPHHRLCLIKSISDQVEKCQMAAPAKAISSIFNSLQELYTSEVQPLELLAKDDLLTGIYNAGQERVRIEPFFTAMGHSKPTMKVLEIGAGTGGTTLEALKSLVSPDGPRMYADYTFTDISAGFFAAAKERFQGYKQIHFQVLDISKDPLEQGFSPYNYDLIIASNVLHATPSLHSTLCNVRKLLAPGGKLFLQELCTDMVFINYVMGILPGWWVGECDGRSDKPFVSVDRWDQELRNSGFTGVESAPFDDDEPYQMNAHIISSPAEPQAVEGPVTLLYRSDIIDVANNIAQSLIRHGYSVTWRALGQQIPAGQRLVISLLDLEGPFFDTLTPSNWNAFIEHLASAGSMGILWLTKNCQMQCQDPRYSLVLGAARTIRTELSIDFATLEVDRFDSSADFLVNVSGNFIRQRQREGTMTEYEYAVVNDTVHINRYLPFTPAEHRDGPKGDSEKRLSIERKGSLDTLGWMESRQEELAHDHVEIRMEAAGLNFKDVLVAMGVIGGSKTALGLEGSGTVSKIGSSVKSLKGGDRVIVVGSGGCFSTCMVAPEQQCVRIPDNLTFEDAATIPCVFATVIHSLIDLAHLEPDQTILIHSACGGVGQAAIQISQNIGAKVYATVGNDEKARHLMETFGIPKDRVYNSRNTGFLDQLIHDTQGVGVDVVLNSLSGELLHASWRCVAKYGTMIEIGKRDFLDYGRLSMNEFDANRAFFGVDLAPLIRDRPRKVQSCLERCMDLLRQGRVRPIHPTHVFPAEEAEKAFRYMQGGQHIGKIVMKIPEDATRLPTNTALGQPPTLFSSEHSYLLVGGLGGLGRAISTWMVENGARHLVYLSRSAGKSDRNREFFHELETQGCNVTAVPGTVAIVADIEQAVHRSPRPISGVLHLPMVLQDRSLLQMTFDDWKVAVTPKVSGTWNLHRVFEHRTLDFFLIFSSLVGHQGFWGQANYAAGNTFLDAFTQYRRSLGLPANVIDVGVMDEVGYVSEDPATFQRLSSRGLHLLTERELLHAIRVVLSRQRAAKVGGSENSDIGQLPIGLMSKETGVSGLAKDDIRFSVHRNLDTNCQTTQSSVDSPLKGFLSAVVANPKTLLEKSSFELVVQEIAKMLCSFMSLRQDDLDISQSMAALGVDSLDIVEIRKWWRASLGLDISALEIRRMGSIQQLGEFAMESLRGKYLDASAEAPVEH